VLRVYKNIQVIALDSFCEFEILGILIVACMKALGKAQAHYNVRVWNTHLFLFQQLLCHSMS